ncbi:MAG: hypothetical protein HY556_09825 [Euryarchaeota archaeon]|nr:hypothetical protein [Euryarchaeota archaeon]
MGPWGFNWFGMLLVIVGVAFLLSNLGYFPIRWDLIWPVFIIMIGLGMLFGGRRRMWMWRDWDERPRNPPPP